MTDPDGEELVPVDHLQQDDRRLTDEIEAHPVDLHPDHRSALFPIVALR